MQLFVKMLKNRKTEKKANGSGVRFSGLAYCSNSMGFKSTTIMDFLKKNVLGAYVASKNLEVKNPENL